MKRIVALMLAGVILLAGCGGEVDVGNGVLDVPIYEPEQIDPEPEIISEPLNDNKQPELFNYIGLTFNELMEKEPELESAETQWFTVNFYGLKRHNSHIQYNFYGSGTFVRPDVKDAGAEKGNEIRVYSVIVTVSDVFPETTDGMLLDDFLAAIGVTEYEYFYDFDGGYSWATRGIIDFDYDGLYYAIDVSESEEYENYERLKYMCHSFRVLVSNSEIAVANNAPLIEYLDAHGWDR
jgi:hypothetical protein